ncbi:hypothetical protein LSAT2_012641 [Lamellibrachia satsuma]|nr:hypothetical protein LSAT2_012641 [Lamellibrachia satsuma]
MSFGRFPSRVIAPAVCLSGLDRVQRATGRTLGTDSVPRSGVLMETRPNLHADIPIDRPPRPSVYPFPVTATRVAHPSRLSFHPKRYTLVKEGRAVRYCGFTDADTLEWHRGIPTRVTDYVGPVSATPFDWHSRRGVDEWRAIPVPLSTALVPALIALLAAPRLNWHYLHTTRLRTCTFNLTQTNRTVVSTRRTDYSTRRLTVATVIWLHSTREA